MEINEYQRLAARTIRSDLLTNETELHALHGLVSECGEIHEIYQKVYQGHTYNKEHVAIEIGDLMWFIAELCTTLGFDLEDICKANIDKLLIRYPDGFDTKHSLYRAKGDL